MARVAWTVRAVGLGLGIALPGAPARAQEVPLGAPELAASDYEGWGFVDRSPRPGRRFSDVTVHPDDPQLMLAVTQAGTAWLSPDGGASWFPVLDADSSRLGEQSADEQVREQVEADVQDALSDEGVGEVDEAMTDEGVDEATAIELVDEAVQGVATDVASQVQSEVESNSGFLVDQMGDSGREVDATLALDPYRPRGWITADDRLYVAQGDGLMMSTDLGATWDPVLAEPVNALVTLRDGTFVAGTRRGFRRSLDGVRWDAVRDRTEGREVLDMVVVGDRVWAGTVDGLLRSDFDGLHWESAGLLQGKVRAIAVDPSDSNTLWVAFDRTVVTTHDAGNTFAEPAGGVLPGIVDLLAVGPGHVFGVGPQGPFESADAGVTWSARGSGVIDPDTWALAISAGRLWLASDDGLERLEPPEVLALRAAALGTPPPFVPFDALLTSALDRYGLGKTLPAGARFAATALPQFHVDTRWRPNEDLNFLDSRGTQRADDGEFAVVAYLEWTPAGRSSGTVDVLVSDGEVLIDDGGDETLLAARMDRRAADYRRKLASTVTELYYKRAVLVAERAGKRSEPLVVRVDHEIAIQEVEARLDAITGGAVTAWRVVVPEE